MSDAQSYPLTWPLGKPRTKIRHRAPFHRRQAFARDAVPVGYARDMVLAEIARLGGSEPVISTNVRVRLDGLMRAEARVDGGDPGVAIYFLFRGKRMAFACDRWDRVGDNLWAVAKSIEAIRGLERWGAGDMVASAMAGFRALPPPQRPWRMVFGYGAEETPGFGEVQRRYEDAALDAHPDRGGSHEAMAELNAARDDARAELS